MKINIRQTLRLCTAAAFLAAATTHGALVPVTTDIMSGTTVTWSATNSYRLDTVIYVQTNAVLVIEPGTVVYGATNVTIPRRGVPNLISALVVSQGGQLYATGTVDKPIIFTAEGDQLNGNIPPTEVGLWGGVIMLGNAVLNSAKQAVGNVSDPKFDLYEGLENDPNTGLPYPEHRFGGNDDADSSGALRYVSIRHAGFSFAQDSEFNSLTMAGLGHGTVIEYVEVYAGSDDGFEWWGGTAGSKYLVAAFCQDDDFDTDQGYRGTNQFWFGLKAPWMDSTADSRGIESDGDLNQNVFDEAPLNKWTAYNATIIGRGKDVTATDRNAAWNTRDEDVPQVFNSIFAEWDDGLILSSDGLYHFTNAVMQASIRNNIWDVNDGASSTAGQFIFTTGGFNNTVEAAMLGGISYNNDGMMDPRPQAGSPAFNNVLPGAPVAVNYRGAFSGPDDNWADGWTAISQYGYLKPSAVKPVIAVTSDIATGTTQTWKSDFAYRLDTVIYVQTNAVLVIEPGTVVYGATNVTIPRRGVPNLISALVVSQGGQLYATGTVDKPIIFTAEGDQLNGNIPPTEVGLWGGVIMLGNAVLNSAKQAVGNVSDPKFDLYEGLENDPNTGLPYPEHRFGGNDDADSSGALRYVSIRHAGFSFAQDSEFNSLTMAGLGHGTVIEYVEVYAGSDDGFEWWGGTAGSKYLVAAFCQDDDFDTDQGYRGTNQFWFGLKAPWMDSTADSRGIESDGDLNQNVFDEAPLNKWTAYNATIIGRGKDVTATDRNAAWNTRDEDVPQVFNSIFAEWDDGLILSSDGLYHFTNAVMQASIRNNIWDVNDGASSTAGQFIFTTGGFNNTVEAAMLGGISYNNDGMMDPRPQAGSPAFNNVLPGAPVAVNYRGAFSGPDDNWADGWTAISQYGYLKPAPVGVVIVFVAAGDTLEMSVATETGKSYQLQSTTDLGAIPIVWSDEGAAVAGDGMVKNFDQTIGAGDKYFRIQVD